MRPADKKRYFEFVASQDCIQCGSNTVQVCHYTGMDGHMLGKGRGKKAHDLMVFPACLLCHKLIDSYENFTHEDLFVKKMMSSSLVQTYIAITLIRAYEAGVIKL